MKYIILFLITFSLFGCSQTLEDAPSSEIIEGPLGTKLDSLISPYVQELRRLTDNTAALAMGVTKGQKITFAKTWGFSNLEREIEADLNTLFHVASLSKPFTAVAAVKLVEDGKLGLNDRLIDHIPEFKMKGEDYKEITIKQVLTHTSGIPRHIKVDEWLNPEFGPKALESNLLHAEKFELDFRPGSQYSYSNSAFDILGIVVERVSGMRFGHYVERHIMGPLGMKSSTYYKQHDMLPDNWAGAYSYGVSTQAWQPYPYTESAFPSSGVQTSITDMCRWGMMHVARGSSQDHRILSESSFRTLIKEYQETPWGDHMGLGWFLQSYLERPIIMHTGSDTGFEAMIYIFPEEEISITVLANRDFSRSGRIINAVAEAIFEAPMKPYTVSAKYPFAKTFRREGIEKAVSHWKQLQTDTTDAYFTDSDDILTCGAILENGKNWSEARDILKYYNIIDSESTYSWRLLGNANLYLGDTLAAIDCYQKTQEINPNYEKGKIALEALLK